MRIILYDGAMQAKPLRRATDSCPAGYALTCAILEVDRNFCHSSCGRPQPWRVAAATPGLAHCVWRAPDVTARRPAQLTALRVLAQGLPASLTRRRLGATFTPTAIAHDKLPIVAVAQLAPLLEEFG